MSWTIPFPRRALRVAVCAGLLLAAALVAALTLSARSDAAFSSGACQGTNIIGRGASFATQAHNQFIGNFPNYCSSVGSSRTPGVLYEDPGSGAGRIAMGQHGSSGPSNNPGGVNGRSQTPRFGMTDEPPTPIQQNQMEQGVPSVSGDEDDIHVVPAAVGAVTVLVNFPENCAATLLNPESRTDAPGTADDNLVRVRFDKTELERVFAFEPGYRRWTEVFSELATDLDCDKPIIRVVRQDVSGTTFTFKDYLNTINPGRGWLTNPTHGGGATGWPAGGTATFPPGPRSDCSGTSGPGPQDDAIDQLTSSCTGNATNLAIKLNATDGSVGYADIATARTQALDFGPDGDDRYFTQTQNGNGCTSSTCTVGNFTEPTVQPNGFRTGGATGADCSNATFKGVPISTLSDWSPTSGVNSPAGYGICTLTYGLLFDDYANAYSQQNAVEEEAKARSVKDYWTNVLSDGGQGALAAKDYAPLPTNAENILAIARRGVNAVGWDKDNSGSTGNTGNTGGGSTGGGSTGGGSTSPPPAATPSNRFSITRTTINSRRGTATISVRVPGRGIIQALASARSGGKRLRVGGSRVGVSRAGTYRLLIRPGRAAKRVLNKKRRLRTSVRVSYRPTGGTTRNAPARTVTLKLRKRARSR